MRITHQCNLRDLTIKEGAVPVCDRVEGVGGFTDPESGMWIACLTEMKPGQIPGFDGGETLVGDGSGKMYRLTDIERVRGEAIVRQVDKLTELVNALTEPSLNPVQGFEQALGRLQDAIDKHKPATTEFASALDSYLNAAHKLQAARAAVCRKLQEALVPVLMTFGPTFSSADAIQDRLDQLADLVRLPDPEFKPAKLTAWAV